MRSAVLNDAGIGTRLLYNVYYMLRDARSEGASMTRVRVGSGSANERDRPALAHDMVDQGDVEYVCFDNLAERTLALAVLQKARDSRTGYNPLLRERMRLLLAPAKARGVRLIGNMGAANPAAGGDVVIEEAAAAGLDQITVAVVTGDDVLALVQEAPEKFVIWETEGGIETLPGPVVSANAYTGAEGLLTGLRNGADVVVAGRCSDISPYIAALRHSFGWAADDWQHLGAAGLVGHLLECGRYVTGGAHACPTYGKTVPNLEDLSLPLAEVDEDGTAIITKIEGTGGMVTVSTVKEQVLHEIHDPTTYLSPDITLDFSNVRVVQDGPDRVRVSGAAGRPKTDTYKVLLGVDAGWISEGSISFAGAGAVAKAKQCIDFIEQRLARTNAHFNDFRTEMIGIDSTMGALTPRRDRDPYEVRLRIAAQARNRADAEALMIECDDLWFGPIGGAGVQTAIRQNLAMYSTLIPKSAVAIDVVTTSRRWQKEESA